MASVPAKLGAKWTHVDSNQTVNEETRDITFAGDGVTDFQISKPDGWPTGKYKLAFHDRSRSYEPWGSRCRSAWSGSVPYNFEAVKDAPAEVLTVTVGGTTAADVVLQLAYNN